MTRFLTAVVAVAVVASAARADLAEGNWRLSQKLGANESALMLVKIEKKDGKFVASILDKSNPKAPYTIGDLKVDGSTVTLPVNLGRAFTFEGTVAKDGKVVRGSFFDDTMTYRAVLSKQDGDTIERPTPPKPPEQTAEAQKLTAAVGRLRTQAIQSKDTNDRADLLAKAKEAQKEADEKVPGLYKEVIAKHADSPYAADAAAGLLRMSATLKPTADEVAAWVKLIEADAEPYGSRVVQTTLLPIGESLLTQKNTAAAGPVAEKVVKGLKDTDALAIQSRALKLQFAVNKATGKTDSALEPRLAKVEAKLDDEYKAKVPPFKPTKFAGRKDKAANRVVVMELFTGAQCPPCVAADVAFDALEMSYDPKDLVLIQYHMHIPGPDPLTNPSSVARWDYYRAKFAENVRGTPTTLFNGKPFEHYDEDPMHRGGGGMPNAQNKYDQYKAIIDPLLDAKTDVKIGGTVKADGDRIKVAVDVEGVPEPGENVRLHVLLVEETIKYTGGNGLRFHHQVVRALPDGADGAQVKEKSLKKDVMIDLAEVKKGLTKYLDEFAAGRPFPNADRPMDLKNLKVIALVQNHETREILNAAQMDVK
jgi:hypothetical protein